MPENQKQNQVVAVATSSVDQFALMANDKTAQDVNRLAIANTFGVSADSLQQDKDVSRVVRANAADIVSLGGLAAEGTEAGAFTLNEKAFAILLQKSVPVLPNGKYSPRHLHAFILSWKRKVKATGVQIARLDGSFVFIAPTVSASDAVQLASEGIEA